MESNKSFNEEQSVVSDTWSHVWDQYKDAEIDAVFKHRLFIEGYATFERYVPNDLSQLVELGAGTGRYALKFAQNLPDAEILITDVTEKSLMRASEFANKLHISNVKTQIEDVTELSFSDDSIAAIIMDCVIPHVPDYEKAMAEVGRVLKPGGLLVMAHVNPLNIPHTIYRFWVTNIGKGYDYGLERAFSRRDWKRMCETNGLKIVATDGFAVGYGLYRHKNRHKIFKLLGRIVNRLAKIIDRFTGGWCSRTFGFETLTVAIKQNVAS